MQELQPLIASLPPNAAAILDQQLRRKAVSQGETLVDQGDPAKDEILLLCGTAAAHISDPDGRQVCTALYAGPQIVTPQIARAKDGRSLVTIEVLTAGTIARIDADVLQDQMVADPDIRAWGNAALHRELVARGARDWALAALPAKDRLAWFRQDYPRAEARFPHHLIAAFLGMTPVTLSRARHSTR